LSASVSFADETAAVETDWVDAICDVEEACADFCSVADLDPRTNYVRHFEQVSAATRDLLSAALRLERISARLSQEYAEL
jgi:hypothetical protein